MATKLLTLEFVSSITDLYKIMNTYFLYKSQDRMVPMDFENHQVQKGDNLGQRFFVLCIKTINSGFVGIYFQKYKISLCSFNLFFFL